ncbi:MAG: hypothetical protein ACLR4Z_03710 [Butyricicoccaceae bacterium]
MTGRYSRSIPRSRYFGNDEFRRYYTDTAIRFMRCSPDADDTLTYMVFAEQRLLTMCAEKKGIRIAGCPQ